MNFFFKIDVKESFTFFFVYFFKFLFISGIIFYLKLILDQKQVFFVELADLFQKLDPHLIYKQNNTKN